MQPAILIINTGSSSYKCKLFSADQENPETLWEGSLDLFNDNGKMNIHARKGQEQPIDELLDLNDDNPLKKLLETINFPHSLVSIGHRVVHGGVIFHAAIRITSEVKEGIRSLSHLAPLHNPANLKGIEQMEALFPSIPQFAVFDTSFHSTIPAYAAEYPIPEHWRNFGIRRYGFHGISHSYCATRAATMINKKLTDINTITCHLGNGSSIAAIEGGVSIDTSMGFTPLEGLMMGTRSGSIDPSIIFYLLREKNLGLEEIEHSLNHDSGLKSISRTNGDMRHVEKGVSLEDLDCTQALEMYVYRIACYIGAMAAALGRVDAIVFTAGIGENSALVREEVCKRLTYLGIAIDDSKNQGCQGDRKISSEDSRIQVLVMHTQEEWAIARECLKALNSAN